MSYLKKWTPFVIGGVFVWLGVKYLLPVALPFLLGLGLALVAEPLVRRFCGKLSRGVSAGLGVSVTLIVVAVGVYFVGAIAVGQLKKLTVVLPDLQKTAIHATQVAEDFLVRLAQQAPEAVQPALQKTVLSFFDDGTVLLQQIGQHVPGLVGTTISRVGEGAIGLGTGVLSAFLISARLPNLRQAVKRRLPPGWHTKVRPCLQRIKKGLGGWFQAQLKLSGVTCGILIVGFTVLRIAHGFVWALGIALVDAVPILGTGTVLAPWALICFLQGDTLRGIGLLCIYAVTALTRTALEPRLVGKQLGIDPLVTLGALYFGYCLWGFFGMLLLPILASAVASAIPKESKP